MSPYDSDDSSGAENDDYTETNVLLGYASKEASDDTISHLGGRPTWLDPTTPPSANLAKCKVCNDFMVLLLQLNGDLPEVFGGHERRLYVLACRRKTCRRKEGSVRALRGVRISEVITKDKKKERSKPEVKQQPVKPTIDIGHALFSSSETPAGAASRNPFATTTSGANAFANPFSTSKPAGSSLSNPMLTPVPQAPLKSPDNPASSNSLPKTFASALSISKDAPQFGPPVQLESWPAESDLPQAYPLYYLADADYEQLDKVEDLPVINQMMEVDDEAGGGSQKEDKIVYESTIDKTFQKFADRLAQNPEQVIRYEFKGQPLLYSKYDAVGKLLSGDKSNEKVQVSSGNTNRMPRCANCGAGRVFEAQLTPHAIMELEREEMSLDGMEWGTIIVGVCEKDCQQQNLNSNVGYIEEFAGVQWEEVKV